MKGKKFALAIFALALVAISAITATIVYCATTLSGGGKTTVTYIADGTIKGTVTAKYQVEGMEEVEWGKITYAGTEANNATNTLSNAETTLTKENKYIVYKFEFVAETDTTASQSGYKATLSFADDATPTINVDVQVSEDGAAYTAVADLSATIKSVDVTTTKTVYVKVSVHETLNNARFAGEFKWNLAKLAG